MASVHPLKSIHGAKTVGPAKSPSPSPQPHPLARDNLQKHRLPSTSFPVPAPALAHAASSSVAPQKVDSSNTTFLAGDDVEHTPLLSPSSEGLNPAPMNHTWFIVGVAVGVIAFTALLAGCIIVRKKRCRNRSIDDAVEVQKGSIFGRKVNPQPEWFARKSPLEYYQQVPPIAILYNNNASVGSTATVATASHSSSLQSIASAPATQQAYHQQQYQQPRSSPVHVARATSPTTSPTSPRPHGPLPARQANALLPPPSPAQPSPGFYDMDSMGEISLDEDNGTSTELPPTNPSSVEG